MDPRDFGRVGVLAGGPSSERDISLESGQAVFNALKNAGADVLLFDIAGNLTREDLKKFDMDVAFIALHGRFGEDGVIQGMLEDLGMPYTGSRPLPSRLSVDKIASKEIFAKNGIEAPAYEVLARGGFNPADLEKICKAFGFPLVVKPRFEGSSIGISIVEDREALREAISAAFVYGDKIIVEEYINGRELTVGIYDDKPLPVVEIVVSEPFYNFKAKYKKDDTEYIVPAKVSSCHYNAAQAKGMLAHRALGCESFSRVDIILDERQDKLFVLEVNSIPGLTGHSLLPKAAACAGIGFSQLCLKIVELALKKRGVTKIGKEI